MKGSRERSRIRHGLCKLKLNSNYLADRKGMNEIAQIILPCASQHQIILLESSTEDSDLYGLLMVPFNQVLQIRLSELSLFVITIIDGKRKKKL